MRRMYTFVRGGIALLLAAIRLGVIDGQARAASGLAVAYSTLWTGQHEAVAEGVAHDGAGNTYVTGVATQSEGVPNDAFVAKYSPGGALLFARTLPNQGCNQT